MGRRKPNWTDILGQKDIVYAVVGKKGRIQVLYKPDDQLLRKLGHKKWDVVGVVRENDPSPENTLLYLVTHGTKTEFVKREHPVKTSA